MDQDQVQQRKELAAVYDNVLRQSHPKPLDRRRMQFFALARSLDVIERRLKRIARLHDFDTWYPCLRRELLGCPTDIDPGGLLLATHVLQKYASNAPGESGSPQHETLTYGTTFRHDHILMIDDSIVDECRDFWETIALYRRHQVLLRELGFGGKFFLDTDGRPAVALSNGIRNALEDFARRRARDEALSEHGVPLRALAEGRDYAIAFVPTLETAPGGAARYRMAFFAWTGASIRDFFVGYDRSLKKAYGLTPDDLTHAFVSLSKPVLDALIALGDGVRATGDTIELAKPLPLDRAYEADIVKELLLKGYARLPTASLVRQIELTPTYWCHTQERRSHVAKQFVSVFGQRAGRRSAVNLERGLGASLLVPANEDYTYIDYCHMRSLLSHVLLTAQKYVGGQHGHNFNLLLEERINEIDPSYVVASQLKFVVPASEKQKKIEGDWDILLLIDGHAICVECKAYIENDAAARGNPKTLFSNATELQNTVDGQSEKELLALNKLLHVYPDLAPLRRALSFSAVVCTLKSEFIEPVDRYSQTPCGLRQLVGMTELLDYCRLKKSQHVGSEPQETIEATRTAP